MSAITSSPDKTEAYIAGLLTPAILAVVVFPIIFVRAYVLTHLWDWYVVPLFGAPLLRMPFAFGLSLIVMFMVNRPMKNTKSKEDPNFWFFALATILGPFAALLAGWIGTFFI